MATIDSQSRDRSWWRRNALALVLAALVVAAAALAIWQFIDRRSYQQELENMYTRSFYELVDEMTTIQTDLGKLQVATSPGGISPVTLRIS